MVVPQEVYSAVIQGNLAVVREYFASGDRDPNDIHEESGCTLLDGACMGRQLNDVGLGPDGYPRRLISCELIAFLLSQGASVDYHQARDLVLEAA
tara:strand:- start:101 stop:385 length:285 start_codon:yes stop_codon:yes gene_type:complete